MRTVIDIQAPPVIHLMPRNGVKALKTAGFEDGWIMPVALWQAPVGFDTSGQPDNRPYHTIAWRLSGALVQRVLPTRHRVEQLSPAGFSIHPANCELRMIADGAIRFAHFYLNDTFIRAVAVEWAGERARQGELLRPDRIMRLDPEVPPMLDAYLRRAFDTGEPATRLEMDCRANLLALHMLRKHSSLKEPLRQGPTGGLSPHHLRRVLDAMNSDLTADISLSTLATMLGLSYHHFCHAFKASTGAAPYQWLVERRVERACKLLRSTEESVTEIAAAVGYDDPNQLSRVFRRRRGTTPVLYRREFQT